MNRSIESTPDSRPLGLGQGKRLSLGAQASCLGLLASTFMLLVPVRGSTEPLGSASIQVVGLAVDIDTRSDVDGFQYELIHSYSWPMSANRERGHTTVGKLEGVRLARSRASSHWRLRFNCSAVLTLVGTSGGGPHA